MTRRRHGLGTTRTLARMAHHKYKAGQRFVKQRSTLLLARPVALPCRFGSYSSIFAKEEVAVIDMPAASCTCHSSLPARPAAVLSARQMKLKIFMIPTPGESDNLMGP